MLRTPGVRAGQIQTRKSEGGLNKGNPWAGAVLCLPPGLLWAGLAGMEERSFSSAKTYGLTALVGFDDDVDMGIPPGKLSNRAFKRHNRLRVHSGIAVMAQDR